MITIPVDVRVDADDPAGWLPFVRATVDGAEHELLLDTGAASTGLPPALLPAGLAAAQPRPGFAVSGVGLGGKRVVVPELRVGGLTVRDLPVDVDEHAVPPRLGADVLQEQAALFRLADGVIELGAPMPAGAFPLELERPGAQPFVELRAGAMRTRACWDTGASITVVDAAFAADHADLFDVSDDAAPGTDASGSAVLAHRATMAACRVAGTELAAAPCVVVDLSAVNAHATWPLHVILGMPHILQADWWFDFPHNAWALAPRRPEGDA